MESTGRKNPRWSIPGIFAEMQGMLYRGSVRCRPYRASDLANSPSLDILPARSYFRAASGELLPYAGKEDSRARACGFQQTSYKVRNPVRAAAFAAAPAHPAGAEQLAAEERPAGERFLSAARSQYLLPQVDE